MLITAKFDGRCAACGRPTKKDSDIEYINKKAYHVECRPREKADSRPALTPSPLPIDAALSPTPTLFLSRGARCGFCLMPIEETARGEEARHEGSLTPYGECEAAKRIPVPVERGGDIQEMRPIDTELIAKLDHYDIDPRDIKHWVHVRETTGGSHRVFRPVFPGEE